MNLIWFRRDLRTKDNLALSQACERGEPVIAVFFETVEQWKLHHLAPIQADLICRRLQVLQHQLAELNIPLIIRRVDLYDDIHASLAQICHEYQITHVYCTKDYEINEYSRDQSIKGMLNLSQTQFHCVDQKCVFTPGQVMNQSGHLYQIFTPFKKAWLNLYHQSPFHPIPAPQKVTVSPKTYTLLQKQGKINFHYPCQSSLDWPVDDQAILQRLREFCKQQVRDYHQSRDFPAISGTSQLSPYLAIGALSPRQCISRLCLESPDCLSLNDSGAAIWLSEIIWREFYQHLIAFHPRIAKGQGFQVWTDSIEWVNDELQFERWKQGKTGYPIVDAGMRQLKQTGWMHNRLRMIVASFLVKDLHIDWRWGEKYFMQRLIDGDFASNNGGWQWSASTGTDAQPYFRIFNPIAQSKKFDGKGAFIRQWVPELDNVPDKHIHQPHAWAEKQGIHLTYPLPIVDHTKARQITLQLFEQAKKRKQKDSANERRNADNASSGA